MTESTIANPCGPMADEPADLAIAMAEAARTADIYRANAAKVREGYRGAPDRAWLTSQSAVCAARRTQCAERARSGDRHASAWQVLTLGYAEAAAILARSGAEDLGTALALQAAAELLSGGASIRPRANSAPPPYVNIEALRAAYREACAERTALALHVLAVEMLLLACYARDHNPVLMTAATDALDICDRARGARIPADITEALDAIGIALREASLDPSLNSS